MTVGRSDRSLRREARQKYRDDRIIRQLRPVVMQDGRWGPGFVGLMIGPGCAGVSRSLNHRCTLPFQVDRCSKAYWAEAENAACALPYYRGVLVVRDS